MASLNKVMLIGNLGKDPQLDYTSNGSARCRFSIATSESYKDKDGVKQERTDWHNIVIWGKLAEIAGEYLKKGRSVYLEGKIQTRQWQDDSDQTRYITEIIAWQMQMLGGRDGGGQNNAPPPEEPNQRSKQPPTQTGGQKQDSFSGNNKDDDLPF